MDFKIVNEIYSHFKEVISLENLIKKHLSNIDEEDKRIAHLKLQISSREDSLSRNQEELERIKKELATHEKSLFDIDKKIENAQTQLGAATTQNTASTLEETIKTLADKKDEFENSILEMMDQLETLENENIEDVEFINGANDSLQKIEIEVITIKEKENQEIKNYKSRIKLIIDELKQPMGSNVESKHNKFELNNFATLYHGHCKSCGTQLAQKDEIEFNSKINIKTCRGCSRYLYIN